tara:strand:- start:335 stop:631 length:297 start_codon:yes stop_codon:yes gene_type:complete
MSRRSVAPGCFFEPDESEIPKDPIVGKKSGLTLKEPELFRRKSELEDIPDDFEARMMGFKTKDRKVKSVDVKVPDGFAVTIAYNKSGYQVIPKDDLKS